MSSLNYAQAGRYVILHKAQGHGGNAFPFPPTSAADGGTILLSTSKANARPLVWEISLFRDDLVPSEESVAAAVLVYAHLPSATASSLTLDVQAPARWVRVGVLLSAFDTGSIVIPFQQRTYVPIDADRLSVALVDTTTETQVNYAGASATGLIVTARAVNQP